MYKQGWNSSTNQTVELPSLSNLKQQHQVQSTCSYKHPVRLDTVQWASAYKIKSIGQNTFVKQHWDISVVLSFNISSPKESQILFTVSSKIVQQLAGMIHINILNFSGGILNKHLRPWPEMILRTIWFWCCEVSSSAHLAFQAFIGAHGINKHWKDYTQTVPVESS